VSATVLEGLISVHPSVEFEAIEADTLNANWKFSEVRPDRYIQPASIHADIERCVAEADNPRRHVLR
jgi:hypothetical protein